MMKGKRARARSVRVHDERWEAAMVKAAERGESLSDAINRFLERYGRGVTVSQLEEHRSSHPRASDGTTHH